MAITNLNEKFAHELRDIYDAEHQFLEGMQLMLQNASDAKLQNMITTHIGQTQQQIRNLEQVFSLLGQEARRETCAGAKGILTEGQKVMKETSQVPAIRDSCIAGAADKVEHYEIASYRGLIQGAQLMNQPEILRLLQENLRQEEQTSQLIEQSSPQLLARASQAQYMGGDHTSQISAS
jgi:ferritin-like metal-binding protein YciE